MSINGWDTRDAQLYNAIRQLPSYGLIGGNMDDPMLSRVQVLKLLETQAKERFQKEYLKRFAPKKELTNG